MGIIQHKTVDNPIPPKGAESAQALWAIQIVTVDSLKWNGFKRLSKLLGRNSVEHSATRLAQVWCDANQNLLKDPQTGKPYPPITVRGQLNPAAIDPEDGNFVGLRIDPHTIKDILTSFIPEWLIDKINKTIFKKDKEQYPPKCKLGVFSQYGEGVWALDEDYVAEKPVIIGNQETVESAWVKYQQRAIDINLQGHDYNLLNKNCHTVNVALNKANPNAVTEFANRGFMRWGANAQTVDASKDFEQVSGSLKDIQNLNHHLAHNIERSHEVALRQQTKSATQTPPDQGDIVASRTHISPQYDHQ